MNRTVSKLTNRLFSNEMVRNILFWVAVLCIAYGTYLNLSPVREGATDGYARRLARYAIRRGGNDRYARRRAGYAMNRANRAIREGRSGRWAIAQATMKAGSAELAAAQARNDASQAKTAADNAAEEAASIAGKAEDAAELADELANIVNESPIGMGAVGELLSS